MSPLCDGVTRLLPGAAPVPLCGAVAFEIVRPGCAPDAVTLEAVTAAGNRPAERRRGTVCTAGGRTFEVAATGDPWPVAAAAPLVVAIVEGEADALALARLRLPGVLVQAAGGTASVRRGAAVVADLPSATSACLVSDAERAAWSMTVDWPGPPLPRAPWSACWRHCGGKHDRRIDADHDAHGAGQPDSYVLAQIVLPLSGVSGPVFRGPRRRGQPSDANSRRTSFAAGVSVAHGDSGEAEAQRRRERSPGRAEEPTSPATAILRTN